MRSGAAKAATSPSCGRFASRVVHVPKGYQARWVTSARLFLSDSMFSLRPRRLLARRQRGLSVQHTSASVFRHVTQFFTRCTVVVACFLFGDYRLTRLQTRRVVCTSGHFVSASPALAADRQPEVCVALRWVCHTALYAGIQLSAYRFSALRPHSSHRRSPLAWASLPRPRLTPLLHGTLLSGRRRRSASALRPPRSARCGRDWRATLA